MIPGMIVAVSDLRPDHFNNPRSGFDQPTGQQAALAERVASVSVFEDLRFTGKIERFASPPRGDQR